MPLQQATLGGGHSDCLYLCTIRKVNPKLHEVEHVSGDPDVITDHRLR
jgi:hypothetical protein